MRRIPGKIFELQTPDSRAARAILAGDPEVLHIALFGQKIHLALRGEARLPRILGLLREGGIRVTTWRETRGSLEDAFIAMLEHRTGEA